MTMPVVLVPGLTTPLLCFLSSMLC